MISRTLVERFKSGGARLNDNNASLPKLKNQRFNRGFGSMRHYRLACLASMLRVAWGTARRRSLEMSFPVTRHTP